MSERAARALELARTAVRAAKYLFTVRAALPRYLRIMAGIAMACTMLPGVPDFGLDEALYVIIGAVLWLRHRELVCVCWAAAVLDRAAA